MKKFFTSKKKENPTITQNQPQTNNTSQLEENMKVSVKFVSDNNAIKNYKVPLQITVNELRKLPPFDNINFKDDIIFHPAYGILLTPYFQLKNLKTKSQVKSTIQKNLKNTNPNFFVLFYKKQHFL
jgi:hypothetical protein